MTGPVPRHDHQSIDQWAQQGLVNSQGRTSPESDLPAVPHRPDDAADLHTAGLPAAGNTTDPAASPAGADSDDDRDTGTAGGEPGTVASPGDAAETAAFEGDGAYSEGRHASGPPAG